MTTPQLAIALLGEFSLTLAGKTAVNFVGDRPISLLAYLLLHRDTPVNRQHLAFTLWPDTSDSQARTNLRNLFFTLRQTLPHADSYLAADSMRLQWRTDADFRLDVADFEAALVAAKTAVSPPEKIMHLETAVSLYKGDLLLGNYDDWLISLREELRQHYLDALHQLVLLLEQQQDYRTAARYSQRLLQQDPLDERNYVQLMRLHAFSGDRAGLRRIYEACTATLRRELGVDPSPATQAAYEQLLNLEVPAAAVASPPPPDSAPSAADAPITAPRSSSLPTPATPFIGREPELAHLAELLADPACRLLTIVGPGGIGKTRLALQTAVGHAPVFTDGVAFVNLTPISTVDRVATTIAAALQLPLSDGVAHESQLMAYLQDKEQLLVLDNMEHLLDAADFLASLLAQAPRLKLLITSRQRLETPEEWSFDLSGLPLPDEQTALAENSAVALFVQTAQRVERYFALTDENRKAVIRICQLVGGMPLGLQLAATWVRVLSCAEIAQEIEKDLDFLSSNQRYLPERQRSIRAVLDYSWQLLRPSEQQVCCQLTLFRGGFTRDAAQAVAGATLSVLASLVDRALINRVSDGRYDMHELVRQYAQALLASDTTAQAAAHKTYATYFQALAEEARLNLQGADSLQWLAQLDVEINNLRAALSWTLAHNETEIGLRLAAALWRYWWWHGHWREGLDWLEQLLAQNAAHPAERTVPNTVIAGAYQGAGVLARNLGDYAQAHSFYEQSLALQRHEGNLNGIAAALMSMANLAMFEADYAQAEALLAETITLYRRTGNTHGLVGAINNKGIVAMYQEDYVQARLLQEENLAFSRLEENPAHIGAALGNLGEVLRYLGEYTQAQQVLNESLLLLRDLNNKQALATTMYDLGRLALDMADLPAASAYFQDCLSLHLEARDPVAVADLLEGVALWAGRKSRPSDCAQMFGAAAALRQTTGTAVPQPERVVQQQIQAEMITAVGADAFEAGWQKGQLLSLEAALLAAQTILT